jgi:hypothetical protein
MAEKAEETGVKEAVKKTTGEAINETKSLTSKIVDKAAGAINKAEDATGKVIARTANSLMSPDSTGKVFLKQVIANSLGEGTEEATEELLYDASKTLFNIS